MRTAIITGSAGLIGSEAVKRLAQEGTRVVGIDNDMRAQLFGAEASTKKSREDLIANVRDYEHHDLDIRDASAVMELFKRHQGKIDAIVHTASQPSHDWAARDPQTDFTVNANGTLNLLEAATEFSSEAPFILWQIGSSQTPFHLYSVNALKIGFVARKCCRSPTMSARRQGEFFGDFDLVFGTPGIRLRLFRQLRGRYLQAVPVAEVSIEIEIDQHDA